MYLQTPGTADGVRFGAVVAGGEGDLDRPGVVKEADDVEVSSGGVPRYFAQPPERIFGFVPEVSSYGYGGGAEAADVGVAGHVGVAR